MKKVILLSILFFSFIQIFSQNIQWQKCLGGSAYDVATSIQQTTDGGFIVVGNAISNDGDVSGNHGGSDYWLTKLSSDNSLLWQKCFGGSYSEYAQDIKETTDGGYIIAGQSNSIDGDVIGNHGGSDYWIVKTDNNGILQWQKSLGGAAEDVAMSIQQTSDGGYIIAGDTYSNDGDVSGNNGESDYWIVKLDNLGSIEWQKCLGGSSFDNATDIQQTTDGGYIVAGYTESNDIDVSGNHGGKDFWIVKLDNTGIIQWQNCMGGSNWDMAYSIDQTIDDGFVVTGSSNSNDGDASVNHGYKDYWIVKLDNVGNIQWQTSLGGSENETGNSIHQTIDTGFIVAGYTYSVDGDVIGNHGQHDSWIVKLDSLGALEWQKCLGGSSFDYARSCHQITPSSYIIAGETESNDGDVSGNNGQNDFWIVNLQTGDIQSTDFNCGDSLYDDRDGKYYQTVQIGNQCWMAENLNVGTRIDGVNDQTNNGLTEKYCYNNIEDSCDIYGGLYQWDELMQYATTEGAQGICPTGWHVPTDEEWKVLEGTVDSQYGVGDAEWDAIGYRGFDASDKLKSSFGWGEFGNGSDDFGFTANPGGSFFIFERIFGNWGLYGNWWTSTQSNSSSAFKRSLDHFYDNIYRYNESKGDGYSIRCIKDTLFSNQQPNLPYSPVPTNGAQNEPISSDLFWSCSDPEGDPITYDVYFGTSPTPTIVASALSDTTYNPGTLDYDSTYYWKIVAHDNHSNSTIGNIWQFTCMSNTSSLNDSLVAHYPFNGNANDESGNNNNGTVNGATLIPDRFGNANSAYNFDGNDYINCGNSSTLNWQNSDYSVSAWVKRNSTGIQYASYQVFAGKQLDGGDYRGWFFRFEPDDSLYFASNYNSNFVGNGKVLSTIDIVDTAWHHYCGVSDGTNGAIKLYVDGVLNNSDTATNDYNIDNASDLFIGRKSNGEYFRGAIDDICIYSRALSEMEVDSLYHENNWNNLNANFTASDTTITLGDTIQFTDLSMGSPTNWLWDFGDGDTDTIQNPSHIYQIDGVFTVTLTVNYGSQTITETKTDYITVSATVDLTLGLVGYWSFDNETATDNSGNGHNGTVYGTVPFTDWEHGKYVTFNGDYNNYVLIPHHAELNFSGSFSVCAWIKKLGAGSVSAHVISKGRDMLSDYYLYTGGQSFTFRYTNNWGGANSAVYVANDDFPLNEWHYVACVVDTANMMTRYYLNGVLMDQDTIDQDFNIVTTYPLIFGRHFTNPTGGSSFPYPCNASLDEVRIYNRALTVSEIWALGVTPSLTANFFTNDTLINLGDTVQFSDLSTGNPTSWLWDFGDGSTDTSQNPTHLYQSTGTYSISLIISKGSNSDTLVITDYVTVEAGINYFINETQNLDDNLVPPNWSLVVHLPVAGLFNGKLEAQPTDAHVSLNRIGVMPANINELILDWDGVIDYSYWGQSTSIKVFFGASYLTCFTMNADYNLNGNIYAIAYYNGNTGNYSELYQLNSAYAYDELAHTARFSNDSIYFSANSILSGSEPFNIAFLLQDSINFQVSAIDSIYFTAYTTTGVTSWLDNIEISLIESSGDPLTANFTASDTTITLGESIQFNDLSTGNPTSWLWDFGDGTSDSVQNPEHIYQAAGTYSVSLVVSDAVSSDTLIMLEYITVLSDVSQTILLNNGWNIASFYVAPQYTLMDSVFKPLVVENSLTKAIDEAGGFMQEIPGIGWMNTIGNMANTEGYYIKVNQNTQLELSGLIVVTPFDIPLSTGWNIMGYPSPDTTDAITVAQPIIDSSYLIKVIDESGGFMQNIPGIGWMNTVGDFTPGEGYYIKVAQNCTLTIGREAPTVTTDNATSITYSTATTGGNVTYNGGVPVTARGVCWSTSSNPTLADTYTTDGNGDGAFISNLTGLTPNTQYFVRAFATNDEGTGYGNEVAFTTSPPTLATVTTNAITNITATTATSGGNVISDGGATVTARGVCWSTSYNPTIADSFTTDGSGTGSFIGNLTGLVENSTYYVRAYATNSEGTAYGNEVFFVTLPPPPPCNGNTSFSYEGQTYSIVEIGSQCWMAENLNVGTMIQGAQSQTNNELIEKYCYDNNPARCSVYGGLYQWDEMMQYTTIQSAQGICPTGWHLPTIEEWNTLTDFLGGPTIAGGEMKEVGTTHWLSPNTGATNNSGFTALPGGVCSDGSCFFLGQLESLWSSSVQSESYAFRIFLRHDWEGIIELYTDKTGGFSVRCLKD